MRLKSLERRYIAVFVMTANREEAEKVARHLVDEKLIACTNIIGPVLSFFWWAMKVERAEEYLLLMKTRSDLFEKLSDEVKILHSYDVPEIVAMPIVNGSKAYMEWLESCLG